MVDLLDGELHTLSGGVRVLPGLASSTGWREVGGLEVTELLADLLRSGDVIVNLPAGIPVGNPYGQSGALDVARHVLALADVVVVVALATPVGVSRLFEWAAVARTLDVDHPAVVFNLAPRSAFARGEIEREVGRVIAPRSVDFFPSDERVRRAGWDGTQVKAGPFAKSVTRAARAWAST